MPNSSGVDFAIHSFVTVLKLREKRWIMEILLFLAVPEIFFVVVSELI